jgi:2-keto-3-deoxy-L-rhamnonate aldolase RhmA
MSPNMSKIKQALRDGKHVTMVRMGFNSPKMVEFIGQLGFDAVLIDCEHTSASVERVEEMVRAARVANIAAIVRPEMLNDAIITRYLDCKADGIMAPHIDDAASARRLCEIVRYARPQSYKDLLLVAMIESKQAIDNLDEILTVEDIDILFLARVDLSKSLGFGGAKHHPAVRKMVDDAVAHIRAKGRIAGAAGDLDNVATVVEQGAKLIFVSVEDLVRHGCEVYLDRARKKSKSGAESY